jgi:hypothetical protein
MRRFLTTEYPDYAEIQSLFFRVFRVFCGSASLEFTCESYELRIYAT